MTYTSYLHSDAMTIYVLLSIIYSLVSLGALRSQNVTYTNWMPPGQIIHFCRLLVCIGSSPSGPGLWRGNPLLARNPAYQQYLRQHLEDIIPKLPSEWSPAKSWDHIKRQVKLLTRTFAVDYTNWRTKTIRKLQSNRNKFLRSKPPLAIRIIVFTCLPKLLYNGFRF